MNIFQTVEIKEDEDHYGSEFLRTDASQYLLKYKTIHFFLMCFYKLLIIQCLLTLQIVSLHTIMRQLKVQITPTMVNIRVHQVGMEEGRPTVLTPQGHLKPPAAPNLTPLLNSKLDVDRTPQNDQK